MSAKRHAEEIKTEVKVKAESLEDGEVKVEKKPKIVAATVVPKPKPSVLKWRTRIYALRTSPQFSPYYFALGYLKEEISSQREALEYRGTLCRSDKELFVATTDMVQRPYLRGFDLPVFAEFDSYRGGAKSSKVYLTKTRGLDLMPGLTDRVLAYIHEHLEDNDKTVRLAQTMLSDLSIAYERKVIERDNLYHIYATWLYSQVTSFHLILEELFLFIVTGERSSNNSGLMITEDHIKPLCKLIAAEATYGTPERIAHFDSCRRSSALNIANVIADLYLAMAEQGRTDTFVRPLLPSGLGGPHAHDTALSGIVVKYYGLDALKRDWHADL